MTKQDFIAFAKEIKQQYIYDMANAIGNNQVEKSLKETQARIDFSNRRALVVKVASKLNPNFDVNKFDELLNKDLNQIK